MESAAWDCGADLPPSAEQAWLPLIEASFHVDTDARAVLSLSAEAAEHARAQLRRQQLRQEQLISPHS